MKHRKIVCWCWIEDRAIDAEMWHSGGTTRADAIQAARKAKFRRFVIAPCVAATARDVRDWSGCDDINLGSSIVDSDRAEYFPPLKKRK